MPPKGKGKTAAQEGVIEVDEHQVRLGPRMSWSELQSVNAVPGRTSHHAILFDGKLIAIGGWQGIAGLRQLKEKQQNSHQHQQTDSDSNDHAKDLTYFDFGTNQWNSLFHVEGPHHPGSSQASMIDYNGVLFFFGGWTGKSRTNEVSLLNLETMTWGPLTTTGDRPSPVTFHSGSLSNKRFYVFGGNTYEGQSSEMHYLDLGTKVWGHATSLGAPSKRSSHSACVMNDHIIVIFGGRGGADGTQALNDVALFDTTNNHWMIGVKVDGAPPPRYGHSAIAMRNKVIIFGGVGDQGQLLNDAWVLEMDKPNTLFWSRIQPEGQLPTPRAGHAVVEALSSMYVIGGRVDPSGNTTSSIYGLDLSAVAPMPSTAGTALSEGESEGTLVRSTSSALS